MRWLTFNTWHGLSGRGVWRFGELEEPSRRLARRQALLSGLRQLDCDLIFLQELNPVTVLAPQLASALGLEGVHWVDNAGLKWKFSGVPLNLQSGLAIFFPRSWRLHRTWAVPLSGEEWAHHESDWSVQFKESRFALLADLETPDGLRFLAVNVHLHHGLELDAELRATVGRALDGARVEGNPRWQFLGRLAAGNERRRREVERLLEAIEDAGGWDRPVFLGGDFNSQPSSETLARLGAAGFIDIWGELRANEPGLTWHASANVANHALMSGFAAGFDAAEFSGAEFAGAIAAVRAAETKPRRIDYLLFRPSVPRFSPKSVEMVFTAPDGVTEVLPSDHFGLLAEF